MNTSNANFNILHLFTKIVKYKFGFNLTLFRNSSQSKPPSAKYSFYWDTLIMHGQKWLGHIHRLHGMHSVMVCFISHALALYKEVIQGMPSYMYTYFENQCSSHQKWGKLFPSVSPIQVFFTTKFLISKFYCIQN